MATNRTYFLGSACCVAMVVCLVTSTMAAIVMTPAVIKHAGATAAPVTIASLQMPFRGSFGD